MKRLIFFLVAVLLATSIIPEYSVGQTEIPILFTQQELANISIDNQNYMSLRWELVSTVDVQIYWSAYDDPNTVLGQYVIEADETYRDPLKSLYLSWNGNITTEGRIELSIRNVASNKPITIQFSQYTGETSPFGRPPTTYKVSVAADDGQSYMIYLADSPSYGFIFTLQENGTIPLLQIYNERGHLKTSYWVTSIMQSYEYGGVEGVGFLVEKVISSPRRVMSVIYAGKDIIVKPVAGWGTTTKPFPFATITPSKVEPGQTVEVVLQLPRETAEYVSNIRNYPVTDPVQTYDATTEKYTVTFSFLAEARGKLYTLSFSSVVGDTEYKSDLQVEVVPYGWESFVLPIFGIGFIGFLVFLVIYLVRRRTEPLHPEDAFKTAEEWS